MPVTIVRPKSYVSSLSRATAELTRSGMREAAQAGRHTAPIPLGYQKDIAPSAKPGVPIVDIVKAPLVAHLFALALEGKTLRTILKEVHSLGLTAKDGKPISLATLARVLTNPFYMGLIRYEGKLYPGLHQPLISQQDFRRVQLLLTKRRKL